MDDRAKAIRRQVIRRVRYATNALALEANRIRLDTPDPEECDVCWRMTFLPSGWEMWGGTNTTGFCTACGYERTEDEAYELAASEAIDRHLAAD